MSSRLRPGRLLAVALLGSGLVAACTPTPLEEPGPEPTATTASPPNLELHESGVGSPIAYGIRVPTGAVQLGPLARFRSEDLVAAYMPDLEAELARREAEQAAEDAENADPSASTATPTPTPTESTASPRPAVPTADAFALLDEPPRPDVHVALMRIDGTPTEVVQRMLGELSVLLPDEDIVLDDLGAYCTARERRVVGCELDVTGTTPGGRELHVRLEVDPGDVTTRTGNPASRMRPVMALTLEYAGDPRKGQENRDPEKLGDVPDVRPDASGFIWPKMDEDAPDATSLAGPWLESQDGTLLLSGTDFAVAATARSSQAATMVDEFLASTAKGQPVRSDVIVQLNEATTVSRKRLDDGSRVIAMTTVSARGNFVYLMLSEPDPEDD